QENSVLTQQWQTLAQAHHIPLVDDADNLLTLEQSLNQQELILTEKLDSYQQLEAQTHQKNTHFLNAKEQFNQQQQSGKQQQNDLDYLQKTIQSAIEKQGYTLTEFEQFTRWLAARQQEHQQYQSQLKELQLLQQSLREQQVTQNEKKRYLAEKQAELEALLAKLSQQQHQQTQWQDQRQGHRRKTLRN
ncbi:exonuclease subunit SbcC, partial [Providencia manganoxydans]